MICTGAPFVSDAMKYYIELYNQWYQFNLEIYKIWYSPFLNTEKDRHYDADTISTEPDQDYPQ